MDEFPQGRGFLLLPLVKSEEDLLPLALTVAALYGDRDPELVQHVSGTREALTKTTGSWVHSDEPSWMIAMRGQFTGPAPSLPVPGDDHGRDEMTTWSVQVLVVSINSGRVMDSGGGRKYPDLASVGEVVTDYQRAA